METQLAMVMEEQETGLWVATITLPYLPPSKNTFDAWPPMWKRSAGVKWDRFLREKFVELQFPDAKCVGVKAQLWFASRRRRDWQNYVYPLMHWISDALVHGQVLDDDTPDKFTVGGNGGIEFVIDHRTYVPASTRQRTVIAFALKT